MKTHVTAKLSEHRSRNGVLILVGVAFLLATLHYLRNGSTETFPRHINLPIRDLPNGVSTYSQVLPTPERVISSTQAVDGCNIEAINGENYDKLVHVHRGTPIGIGGWLIDQADRTNADHAVIELNNGTEYISLQVPITNRSRRQDVQDYFHGRKGYAFAGFISNIDTSTMKTGTYHIDIVYPSHHSYLRCDNGRQLNITE